MICIGIDVAKDKHDCFILSSEGEVLADVFTIPNSIIALPLAPLGVLANRKFFRSITKGLILRSARLLEISSLPSFR